MMIDFNRDLSASIYEARGKDHQEYHVNEHLFEDGCGWCIVERCKSCRGRGMTEKCDICKICDGRGRIL